MKKQPQRKDELRKNTRISEAMFYRTIGLLEDFKVLTKTEHGYSLYDYCDDEEKVVTVIKSWREITFRCPSLGEIANEANLLPEVAESLARKTHDRTGWSMPNQAMIDSAAEQLGEVLACAARIQDLGLTRMNEDFDYDNQPEIVKAAHVFLEKYPGLVPVRVVDERGRGEQIVWSFEALKYLGRNYQPKDNTRLDITAMKFG
jgi:hypothetical protein